MDYNLPGPENTYCFLNKILIAGEAREEIYKQYVSNCLNRLKEENLRFYLPNCHFDKLKLYWLVYHISQSGISSVEGQKSAILSLEATRKLRSSPGSVHCIRKFLPNRAQISHPLHQISKKSTNFSWDESHQNRSLEIKNRIAHATENFYYILQLETRVKCDASRSGLVAALEKLTKDELKSITFTSRFLNSCKERYSVNELELLGLIWSVAYFKNYLYDKEFKVITDHRSLLSIL